MRIQSICILIGIGALCQGCELSQNCTHNVIHETHSFVSNCVFQSRSEKLATQVWSQVAHASPGQIFSEDYVRGFKVGFVDYLDAGDPCEPPAVLPQRYQGIRYESPDGRAAIAAWIAGFRRGAQEARVGGYRQWLLQPVSAVDAHRPAGDLPGPAEVSSKESQPRTPSKPSFVPPEPTRGEGTGENQDHVPPPSNRLPMILPPIPDDGQDARCRPLFRLLLFPLRLTPLTLLPHPIPLPWAGRCRNQPTRAWEANVLRLTRRTPKSRYRCCLPRSCRWIRRRTGTAS